MAEESLLEFPCEFPIKIMGERRDEFSQLMLEIIMRHAPDFAATAVETKSSKTGKYLSLTCTIHATSREQLDDLYRELSAHPLVSMVL
jgi:putative lipoic acid-binding regulatory protein